MELLETDDPKNLLIRKSEKHKKVLEDEVKLLSENTQKIVTNALVIGGTLALTYLLIRQFSKSKAKKKKAKKIHVIKASEPQVETAAADDDSEPGIVSQIGSALAAQATVFLLGLAKDKLSAFLQTHFDKEADTKA
jgi:hypothetical protein